MQYYFSGRAKKNKGKEPTSIATVLNDDLLTLFNQEEDEEMRKLKNIADLEYLREKAQDRTNWRDFVNKIVKAIRAKVFKEIKDKTAASRLKRHKEQTVVLSHPSGKNRTGPAIA